MSTRFRPGRIGEGTVDHNYPAVDPRSRTDAVRLAFDSPVGLLTGHMFTPVVICGGPR